MCFSFLSYSAMAVACTDSIRETVGKRNKMIEEVGKKFNQYTRGHVALEIGLQLQKNYLSNMKDNTGLLTK